MCSKIRKRLTYANVAMTLALVFAMSGGALAAGKYLITSTKQISPKVLKSLKGHNGKDGAPGQAGLQGPQGAKGETGAAGKDGAPSTPGEKGSAGATGPKGATGSPWTAGGTLPSGATETGTWEASTLTATSKVGLAPMSFTVPLKKAPVNAFFVSAEAVEKGKIPAGCSGTAAEPKAENGLLCVFEGFPTGAVTSGQFPFGLGTTGAVFNFEKSTEGGFASGTWAVTSE